MKIKTKGKCPKCGKMYAAAQAGSHLLSCVLHTSTQHSQPMTEGYLIRISGEELPSTYWIFATIPKNGSLKLLDTFLRDTWLECCGHLSEFTINGRSYFSRTESGYPSQSMKKQIGQLLSLGSICEYRYDMGSSTYLLIQVIAEIQDCPQKKVTLLMQNESPDFSCESCKKTATLICAQCLNKMCLPCSKRHSCVVKEREDYMLMTLVNSPRTGVCGYEGNQ